MKRIYKLVPALFLLCFLYGCTTSQNPSTRNTTATAPVIEQPARNQPPPPPSSPDSTQGSIVAAQIQMQIGEELVQNSVSILNESSSRVTFYLGESGKKLTAFHLNGGLFWYSPNFEQDPMIVVYSPNTRVYYQLKSGRSYKIFWDKQRRRWDVAEFDRS